MKNYTTKAAPEIGTQATGVYVDDKLVGYITENYDFSGRVSIAAYVGSGRHNAQRLNGYGHSYGNRVEAFDAIKAAVN